MVGRQVSAVEVADQVEGPLEVGLDRAEGEPRGRQPMFDCREFGADPVLLGLQQIERDGPA